MTFWNRGGCVKELLQKRCSTVRADELSHAVIEFVIIIIIIIIISVFLERFSM